MGASDAFQGPLYSGHNFALYFILKPLQGLSDRFYAVKTLKISSINHTNTLICLIMSFQEIKGHVFQRGFLSIRSEQGAPVGSFVK